MDKASLLERSVRKCRKSSWVESFWKSGVLSTRRYIKSIIPLNFLPTKNSLSDALLQCRLFVGALLQCSLFVGALLQYEERCNLAMPAYATLHILFYKMKTRISGQLLRSMLAASPSFHIHSGIYRVFRFKYRIQIVYPYSRFTSSTIYLLFSIALSISLFSAFFCSADVIPPTIGSPTMFPF